MTIEINMFCEFTLFTDDEQQQSIPVPVNILGHHKIGQQTTRRPYVNVPHRVYPVPQPPPLQSYVIHHHTVSLEVRSS